MPTARRTTPPIGPGSPVGGLTPPEAPLHVPRDGPAQTAYEATVAASYYYDPTLFVASPGMPQFTKGNGNGNNAADSSGFDSQSPTTSPMPTAATGGPVPLSPMRATVCSTNNTSFASGVVATRPRSDTPPIAPALMHRVAFVTGNAHPQLAHDVAALLGRPLHPVAVSEFASGEISIRTGEAVTGRDVFIVQPTCGNPKTGIDINEALLELLFLIRKMRQGYAASVTAVVPFFAYSRQDRKTDLRVPISAAVVASMVMQMGVDRVITIDLHSGQIQGAYNRVPVDSLLMAHEHAQFLRNSPWFDVESTVIVSPDAGGVERARRLADILCVGRGVVTIVKRHLEGGRVDCLQTVGEVSGLTCIIVDDIVDTGGTLVKACELLKEMGAARIVACCTHAVMTPPACQRVAECRALDLLVTSDSMPQEQHQAECNGKMAVLPTAPLLALTIVECVRNSSTGALFHAPADLERLKRATTSTVFA